MKKHIITLALLSLSAQVFGAEADNFTARRLELTDVSSEVNTLANKYLKQAVDDLNSKNSGCNEDALYAELRKYFANHSSGEFTKDILYKNAVSIYVLPLKESVYSSWKPLNGFLLGRKKAASSPLALSPLIKIGNEVVGVDKFEHMFGMGFTYFTKHYKKEKDIKSVLKYGVFLEKTILGGNILATGVFSYADLSANFNGMRFWNHVLLKQDDILGADQNLGPYLVCNNNAWSMNGNNPIDFKKYIDPSMDESINCSKFATKASLHKFQDQIKKLGFVKDENSVCPVETQKLQDMKEKYRAHDIGHFILNDDGLEDVSYFNEF